MYIVICADSKTIDMSSFKPFEMNDSIFGPFNEKYQAEEWVDNYCGKYYWSIVQLNKQYEY